MRRDLLSLSRMGESGTRKAFEKSMLSELGPHLSEKKTYFTVSAPRRSCDAQRGYKLSIQGTPVQYRQF